MPDGKAVEQDFDATIGLGSNIGNKTGNIDRAVAILTRNGDIRVVRQSRKYRSEPWGVLDQDWFVNACLAVATELSARELLQRCQQVEKDMGRQRLRHWGPRLIDVDVLTYRDQTIRQPDLSVPHPLIAERAFVLLPLQDVAPGLKIEGKTIGSMLAALGESGTTTVKTWT
jgi:2-amino-4-hydroxy-6-hydroxymethyldihydropteridine diphosphokinase